MWITDAINLQETSGESWQGHFKWSVSTVAFLDGTLDLMKNLCLPSWQIDTISAS